MKRADWVVVASVLIAAGALFLLTRALSGTAKEPPAVKVFVGGTLTDTLPLKQSAYEVTIEGGAGVNRLLVEPDGVRVAYADCASQVCVHTGKITVPGQMIACLPHRLLIRLTGGEEESEVDAVAG